MYSALVEALDQLNKSAEIIFVDDGSKDGSAPVLDNLAARDPRVRVLHLSRNYGQTAALMAAIQNSTGDVIIPMDGDGQNDPADIPRLLDKLNEGFDVVSGWRKEREDAALSRRLPSVIANRLISSLLHLPLHDYGCTLKAYRREVVEDVRLYGEMHRFIPIYAAWEGASVTELPVGHHPRRFGKSKYGITRVARVLLDLLILYFIDRAFDRPIQFFGKFGIGFLFLSLGSFCLGACTQIRSRRFADSDAAAIALGNDWPIRNTVPAPRRDGRGTGAHLFRIAREAALQNQAGCSARRDPSAAGRGARLVIASCAVLPVLPVRGRRHSVSLRR